MPPRTPIEFVRQILGGRIQPAGNRVQLEDENGVPYSAINPLPGGGLTDAELRAAPVPISAAVLPLPTGAAQDGTDVTVPFAMPLGGVGIRGWLSAIWTKLNATLGVTGTFWQATQPVSGTFWQATQPVSGAVTNTPATTEVHLGAVGGHTAVISVTPTLTVHANYVANDYVGETNVPMTFAGCGRANAGTGIVISAELIDYALRSIATELWLFNTTVTPPVDSAAWTITDAEMLTLVCVIPFNVYYASAVNSASPVGNLTYPYKCGAASTALFGVLVTRGAPAYASGDVTIRLGVSQD